MLTKYSNFVFKAKLTCIIGILLLFLSIIIIPVLSSERKYATFHINNKHKETSHAETIHSVISPQLQIINKTGAIYNISSESATHKEEDLLMLNMVKSRLNNDGQNDLIVEADQAKFYRNTDMVNLEQNIWFQQKNGECQGNLKKITINLKNFTAKSSYPVNINCKSGSLKANGLTFWHKEKKAIFDGPVKIVLYKEN